MVLILFQSNSNKGERERRQNKFLFEKNQRKIGQRIGSFFTK